MIQTCDTGLDCGECLSCGYTQEEKDISQSTDFIDVEEKENNNIIFFIDKNDSNVYFWFDDQLKCWLCCKKVYKNEKEMNLYPMKYIRNLGIEIEI